MTNGTTRAGGMDNLSKQELLRIIEQKNAQIDRLQRGTQALRGSMRRLQVEIIYPFDPGAQLNESAAESRDRIDESLGTGLKVAQSMTVTFKKLVPGSSTVYKTGTFQSKPEVVTNKSQTLRALMSTQSQIIRRVENWMAEGSDWLVDKITEHLLSLYKYEPVSTINQVVGDTEDQEPEEYVVKPNKAGSSYLQLSKVLNNSMKGLINIKNVGDHKCFMWCHVRFLRPVLTNPGRISVQDTKLAETLDYSGIRFPVAFSDIPRIEEQNDLKVNVFGYEM